jgi:hypothetical protein
MRLHMYLDEHVDTSVPVLFINNHQIHISERELNTLLDDILWVKDCMSKVNARRYQNLAAKYKEQSHAH